MTNAERFDQIFGVGQANLAVASCEWWDREYKTLPNPFTESAIKLIENCPSLINRFAEKIDSLIDNWEFNDAPLEPIEIEIAHVGYTAEQCGYEK